MNKSKKQKIVGILGGMGPYATATFFHAVLDLTPAKKDWEHIHLVIDNAPGIPSRTRHFLYGEESPVAGMIECCKRLEAYPVDFIVIPCNSAHYFIKQISPHIKIPILNMIDLTVSSLKEYGISQGRCAVLGGRLTYAAKTYKEPLMQQGHIYVEHDEQTQSEVENFIEAIKLNDISKELNKSYCKLVMSLKKKYGINAIILGCTELNVFKHEMEGVMIIDSSTELAKAVVEKATSRREK